MADDITRLRNALLWAFDRLSIDRGMTAKEQCATATELGKVLRGMHSPAASYEPDERAGSAKLLSRAHH